MRKFLLLACLTLLSAAAAAVELPVLNWNPGSDWINVKTMGAKGDGKTDDTVALQKAFAAMDDGSVVYFPAGNYVVKKPLTILKTRNIAREGRLTGNAIYGHGRDTVLTWEGPEGGAVFYDMGMVHCRVIGLVFEGNNRADYGIHHWNDKKFETHLYNEFLHFRNFRKCGLFFDLAGGQAGAETAVVSSIFDNCYVATCFNGFNYYDYTLDRCYFLNNRKYGVECVNGNFYVRNSRFERNGIDIFCNPEHGSSVRRSVSIGSGQFLVFFNGISPMTLENNFVADWTGPCAIDLKGAPTTMFDNTFEHKNAAAVPLRTPEDYHLILANNTVRGAKKLARPALAVEVQLPANPRPTTRDTQFMAKTVALPGKHFDAKRDFGARGDGKTDDTEALQRTIDAARAHGHGAIAYLPRGVYRITKTLEVTGKDYWVGGSGTKSEIRFDGSPDADAVAVRPEGVLHFDALYIGRHNLRLDGNKVPLFDGEGAEIRQYPSPSGSRVDYHTIYTTGKYVLAPFILGLRLENLAAHDTVRIDNGEGNLQLINSGAATVLVPLSYEGTVWVKGAARGGFFGIQTRLATHARYSIYLEDNQSMVASDFYIEQAQAETITLKGSSELPPGRVTLTLAKMDRMIRFDGYRGELNLVGSQFYNPAREVKVAAGSDCARLGFFGCFFYLKGYEIGGGIPTAMLGNGTRSDFNHARQKVGQPVTKNDTGLVNAMLDLRRLGELDRKLR